MGEATVRTLEGRTAAPPPTEERADRPSPEGAVQRKPRLWTPRSPRRPRLWFEVLLIAVSYWTYSLVRNAVPEQRAAGGGPARKLWWLGHQQPHTGGNTHHQPRKSVRGVVEGGMSKN
ncbi:hypothetical protein ACFWYJ_30470, partial [Streptomyces albireticuli]